MIRNDAFWKTELDAPLLNKNAGFVNKNDVEMLLSRAERWLDFVSQKGLVHIPSWKTYCSDAQSQRIFRLDAERTFVDPKHRQDFIETLATIFEEIQDYHQGLGFIVAFLMLFLDKETVAKIAIGLHRHYIPGYFKAAPVAYVRDAKTFEKLMEKKFPALHKHITSLVPAEAYCSKWFVGFNVHVLTFEALAEFFEAFFEIGADFHFQYAMALLDNIMLDLIATKDVSRVLAMLRLDVSEYPISKSTTTEKAAGSFFRKIVSDSKIIDLTEFDIHKLRENVLQDMAAQDELRKKREAEMNSDDEIVFSDEE